MGTVVSQHELDGLFLDTPCLGYLSSKLDADPKNIDAILRGACNSIRGIGNRTVSLLTICYYVFPNGSPPDENDTKWVAFVHRTR